jgi:hypothetical protein
MKNFMSISIQLLFLTFLANIASANGEYYDLDNPALSSPKSSEEKREEGIDCDALQYLFSTGDKITNENSDSNNRCSESKDLSKPPAPCNPIITPPKCEEKKRCDTSVKPSPCPPKKELKPCKLPPPWPCQPCPPCPCKPCKPCCQETPKTGEPCNCAYNAPARVDPACGLDMWLMGSFLYFKPKEEGIELGVDSQMKSSSNDRDYFNDPIDLKTRYSPGFNIEIGCSSDRDNWCGCFRYTRFYFSHKNSLAIQDGGVDSHRIDTPWVSDFLFITPIFSDRGFVSSLNLRWKLQLNIFDLSLSRPYYVGRKVIFSPLFGLRGGLLNQKVKANATISDTTNLNHSFFFRNNTRSKSRFIGPRAGIDSFWCLGCGFKIGGNIDCSLLYQEFNSKIRANSPQQTLNPIRIGERAKYKQIYLTPNLDLGLSLGFGSYLSNYTKHFDLLASYEFHYFWDQDMVRFINDRISGDFNEDKFYQIGNLMFHGLSVSLKVDF